MAPRDDKEDRDGRVWVDRNWQVGLRRVAEMPRCPTCNLPAEFLELTETPEGIPVAIAHCLHDDTEWTLGIILMGDD